MRSLCQVLLATGFFAPSIALANPGDATLTIDNRFDGEAEVLVDGKLEGVAHADRATSFEVRPGLRQVSVVRPGTGYVLASARMDLDPCSSRSLSVFVPDGQVRVDNEGEVALKVDVGGTSIWLQPGSVTVLPVKAGNLTIAASIHDPNGDWTAIERDLWVEPGRIASTTLRPDPGVVVVTNGGLVPVRALFDGNDAGWLQPGETDRIWVRPGATRVVLTDRIGHVVATDVLVVDRGEVEKIAVVPTVVVLRD